jgi:hypothetical protein
MHDHDGCIDVDQTKLHIEQFGLSVIHVSEDESGPAFSYSVGLEQTYRHPEIIVFGLAQESRHTIINNCAIEIKSGKTYSPDKLYGDILPDYDCAFKIVLFEWYDDYVGQAQRFYQGSSFQLLQCIWPDLSHKLPWQPGFNESWHHRQALLYGPYGTNPAVDMHAPWPFIEPEARASFSCKRLLEGKGSLCRVTHDYPDGDWQVLDDCDHTLILEPSLVCLSDLVKKFPELLQLANLPLGWVAERDSQTGVWNRSRM